MKACRRLAETAAGNVSCGGYSKLGASMALA
jgi:hypothetical protein